mmetsp:Transcript_26704/g.48981  ORF Transcript_26704/g.48981 Transcript_26704/m.48981 type:complete len:205 (+) Transcript_26704:53-667(+)
MMHIIWGSIERVSDDSSDSQQQAILDRALQDPRIQWCDDSSDSDEEEQPKGGVQPIQIPGHLAKAGGNFGGWDEVNILSRTLAAFGAATPPGGDVRSCGEFDATSQPPSHSSADGGSSYASQSSENTYYGGLPSVGSAKHGFGCTPCYFFARARCHAGEKCRNCHFEHAKLYRPGKRRGEKQRRALRVAGTGGEGAGSSVSSRP